MPKVPDHVTQETVGQKVVHGLNGWKGVFTGWYGGTYHMYDAQGSLDTIFHGVDQDELKVVSSTHNRTIRSNKITVYKLIIN